jgi:hypothetical protein
LLRGIAKDLTAGKPARLVTAGPDDVHIWVGIGTYGATGVSGGPNFYVGGPKIKTELGHLESGNTWESDLEEGEEVWVLLAEELPFATTWRISATVRSVSSRNGGRHAAQDPAPQLRVCHNGIRVTNI